MTKQETAIELEVAEMTDEQVPNQAAQALVESREILPTVDHPVEVEPVDLKAPELYINRELSHLQFNVRVLEQSLVERHP